MKKFQSDFYKLSFFLFALLTERHEVRWTDCCVWVSLPREAPEAEVFSGESTLGVCPAGGALCIARVPVVLFFDPLMVGHAGKGCDPGGISCLC